MIPIAKQFRCTALTLLLLIALLFCGAPTPSSAEFVRTPGATLRLCYLYFGGIDDLGFNFIFNIGRLKTQEELRKRFPDIKIESLYEPNMFFGVDNKTALIIEYVQRGCHAFVANSEAQFGFTDGVNWLASTYRNVSLIILSDLRQYDTSHSNALFLAFDFSQAFQLAGVQAATEAVRGVASPSTDACIGFISAYEYKRNPNDATNGFIYGVRSVAPTLPIHVVTTNKWYWPAAELRAAENLLQRNCSVIGHFTDPRSIDVLVGKRKFDATGRRRLFSVGPHSNLQHYVGDSVLSAVYNDWATILIPILSVLATTGRISHSGVPYVKSVQHGAIIVSPASAYAGLDTVNAVTAARAAMVGKSNPFCGTVKLRDGRTVVAGGTDGCVTGIQRRDNITSYIADDHTTYHPLFKFQTDCPAGTTFSHSVTGPLTLTCTPCPVNTFSATPGSGVCQACEPGFEANTTGSANCTLIPRAAEKAVNDSSSLSVGVIVAVVIVAALATSAVLFVVVVRLKAAARNKKAPKEAPLCILFTDIELSTTLWQSHPDAMSEAINTHHQVIRRVIHEHDAYEVKTVGDAFMIAAPDALTGVLVATEIQTALQEATWPAEFAYNANAASKNNQLVNPSAPINGLKVRIGVQLCSDVTAKYEALHNYYDYYGNDVNLASRVESQARGGQVLLTLDTLEALRDHPMYQSTLADELQVKLFAKNVVLKGVSIPHSLFSVLPNALSGRVFEPLEGHEHEDEHENDNVSNSESASQISHSGIVQSCLSAAFEPLTPDRQLVVVTEFLKAHKLPRHGSNTKRLIRQFARHVEEHGGHATTPMHNDAPSLRRPSNASGEANSQAQAHPNQVE